MRYYKIEEILKRSKNSQLVKERLESTGAVHAGPVESVSSIYLATDPNTGKVHHEMHVSSRPATTEYFAFNDTDKYGDYKENEQLPLFHSRETPGTFHVGIAFGSEKGRTHAMLMGATAKARGEELVGPTKLQASKDLSPHSFKVVQGLQERGILHRNNYPSQPTNTVDFINESALHTIDEYADPYDPRSPQVEIVPAEDLKRGKSELKRFLGRLPKPSKPVNTDQFHETQAPTLFDQ